MTGRLEDEPGDVVRATCSCGWSTTRAAGRYGAARDAYAESALLAHRGHAHDRPAIPTPEPARPWWAQGAPAA